MTADLQLGELQSEDERRAFLDVLAERIDVLLGQALIQLVRVQHQSTDSVIDALGGLHTDLQAFREELGRKLDGDGTRVELAHVLDGATGVQLRDGARARVWIGEMTVRGAGSIGIHVGRD